MADLDLSGVSADAASAANAAFNAKLKSGGGLSDAAQAGIQIGAGVAATAACAATGVGAAVAPLCGLAGGALAKWAGPAIKDAIGWIGGLFSSSPPPEHLIEPSDAIPDPNGVGGLYAQCMVADYLLVKQLSDQTTIIGRAIQAADGVPDDGKILKNLATPLGLVPGGGPPGGSRNFYQAPGLPPYEYDGDYIPPSFYARGAAVEMQWGSGAITNAQAATAMKAILQDAAAWSDKLTVEATRQVMLVATDMVLNQAYQDSGVRNMTGSVADAHNLSPAAQLVELWKVLHGITNGVSFLIIR
ncbi:MAG: hypothetical protein ACRENK_16450 [Gemmatimonadaceae bacterium]